MSFIDSIKGRIWMMGLTKVPVIRFDEKSGIEVFSKVGKGDNTLFDPYKMRGWTIREGSQRYPLRVDGIYTGDAYVVTPAGATISVLYPDMLHPVPVEGGTEKVNIDTSGIKIRFEEAVARLLDADLLTRASNLKPNFTTTMIYCGCTALICFMAGMMYGGR